MFSLEAPNTCLTPNTHCVLSIQEYLCVQYILFIFPFVAEHTEQQYHTLNTPGAFDRSVFNISFLPFYFWQTHTEHQYHTLNTPQTEHLFSLQIKGCSSKLAEGNHL